MFYSKKPRGEIRLKVCVKLFYIVSAYNFLAKLYFCHLS